MCLSKVYIAINGERELIMSEIASLKVEANKLLLTTLLGEHKEISAKISEIDFLTHRIILKDKK
jgi:predicted RNA-binding protein